MKVKRSVVIRYSEAFKHQVIKEVEEGYCNCDQYTTLLKQKGIKISMAAKGNCYENALAERVNGTLKGEFNLDTKFKTKQQAIEAVQQSVYIYNSHLPHWSLKLRTPEQSHEIINQC